VGGGEGKFCLCCMGVCVLNNGVKGFYMRFV
jgi:hypothetical protein